MPPAPARWCPRPLVPPRRWDRGWGPASPTGQWSVPALCSHTRPSGRGPHGPRVWPQEPPRPGLKTPPAQAPKPEGHTKGKTEHIQSKGFTGPLTAKALETQIALRKPHTPAQYRHTSAPACVPPAPEVWQGSQPEALLPKTSPGRTTGFPEASKAKPHPGAGGEGLRGWRMGRHRGPQAVLPSLAQRALCSRTDGVLGSREGVHSSPGAPPLERGNLGHCSLIGPSLGPTPSGKH